MADIRKIEDQIRQLTELHREMLHDLSEMPRNAVGELSMFNAVYYANLAVIHAKAARDEFVDERARTIRDEPIPLSGE